MNKIGRQGAEARAERKRRMIESDACVISSGSVLFQNEKQINAFYTFVDGMDIEIRDIDKAIAEKAAQIRAEYTSFKTLDALQVAFTSFKIKFDRRAR